MIKIIAGLLLIPAVLGGMFLVFISSSAYQGDISDHFDGKHFFNQQKTPDKTLGDFLKWRLNRKAAGSWQEVETLSNKVAVPETNTHDVVATFINHATVLVQIGGKNILTDPVWSERVSPLSFVGPKRFHPPAIPIEELPTIHAVVISHNHYDHLDLETLKKLESHSQPVFIVGLGNSGLLKQEKLSNIVELDWWQKYSLSEDVVITGTPAQHWSTRNRLDRNQTLWLGFVISSMNAQVFFAGDTGMGPHFEQIHKRFGPMDLSLLPIGAYLPRWFMKDNHLSPDDALDAHFILQSQQSMAIHFGTFNLGDDGQFTAADRLKGLLSKQENQDVEFMIPNPGGQVVLKPH